MSHSLGLSAELAAYLATCNPPEHAELERCRRETLRRFPEHAWFQISPEQASYMQFLARLTQPRLALEIGVFTGYSSLALALVMQSIHGESAQLIGCDISEEWSEAAQDHWDAAGVAGIIDLRLGLAASTLDSLISEGRSGTVDFAFIDADKQNSNLYYERVLRLLRPGGLMLVDNILWAGAVADPAVDDSDTVALRDVAHRARDDARVKATACSIGDGLLMCIKA